MSDSFQNSDPTDHGGVEEVSGHESLGWGYIDQLAHQILLRVADSRQTGSSDRSSLNENGAPQAELSILLNSLSRGQLAAEICSNPLAISQQPIKVTLFDFEHYRHILQRESIPASPALNLICSGSPPSTNRFDVAILCLKRDWGAELSRDLLQSFVGSLKDKGDLITVVDHPDDRWLGDHLRDAMKAASKPVAKTVRRFADNGHATGYWVSSSDLDIRSRDFTCQFAFRHQGKLLQAISQPGVFSHRRLDLGARRLMDAMEIGGQDRVLDIGCGSGVVSFAAATMGPEIKITALDSNARAIDCTQRGAELNGLDSQITTILSSNGSGPDPLSFDIALGNPPYFANFQIAELFLQIAQNLVRPGGKIWFVAKQPDWYKANVPRWFDRTRIATVGGGYCIVFGIRPLQDHSKG